MNWYWQLIIGLTILAALGLLYFCTVFWFTTEHQAGTQETTKGTLLRTVGKTWFIINISAVSAALAIVFILAMRGMLINGIP